MLYDYNLNQQVQRLTQQVNCLIKDGCCRVKKCLGISDEGDSNLVLNQQGEWIDGGGDVQTLLSDLPEYLGAKEASLDGKPIGYWYYNTFNNVITKVTNYISSFTAGTSKIDFTNNGGDDWDISFLATPTTVQSSANIVQYMYNVEYWVGGVQTNIESGNKTTDYTLNTSSNGACVYRVDQTYILDNGTFFRIDMLIKVDAVGNVIAYIKNFGSTVNSVNGLDINITANNYQFGVSYPIDWYAYYNVPPSTLTPIGIGATINGSLPLTTVGVGYTFVLGSIFTDDFTLDVGSTTSTNIS